MHTITSMRTIAEKYGLVPGLSVAAFDPATLTVGTALMAGGMAAKGIGAGISAEGTLAGGEFARTAGQMEKTAAYARAGEQDYEASQVEQNASQALAASQRQMLATRENTRLAMSTAIARGAASGVNVAVGSPATDVGELAKRGEYNALMDMFNGESAQSGLLNKAAGIRYGADITRMGGDFAGLEGGEKYYASKLAAAGTLAGGVGGMLSDAGGLFRRPPGT